MRYTYKGTISSFSINIHQHGRRDEHPFKAQSLTSTGTAKQSEKQCGSIDVHLVKCVLQGFPLWLLSSFSRFLPQSKHSVLLRHDLGCPSRA